MCNYKYICSNCGKYCDNTFKRNSTIRDLMWFILIFVSMGLALIFYIIFKLNNRVENCCPFCKAENVLVPTDSPKGQQLINTYYPDNYKNQNIKDENIKNENITFTPDSKKKNIAEFYIYMLIPILIIIFSLLTNK